MRLNYLLFLSSLLLLIGSCKTVERWSDISDEASFDQYRTYKIDDQCSDYNTGVNPITQQRVKNAIEVELRGMGFVKSESPDLLVKFVIKDETEYFYEHCVPEYRNIEGGEYCIDKMFTYTQGTLVIDLIETRRNMAVWHGGGKGTSWENMDGLAERTNELVKLILNQYKNTYEG